MRLIVAVFVLGENIPALLPQTRPIFSMTPPNTTSWDTSNPKKNKSFTSCRS